MKDLELTFPVLMDQNGELGDALGVIGLPTTFYIDRDGRVTGSHIGPLDLPRLEELASELAQP
jgi:hypothetical protein